eukprot:1180153-Rhodomonas_salina.1
MLKSRDVGRSWTCSTIIDAFEKAVKPLICLLEHVPLQTAQGDSSMPMLCTDYAQAPYDEGLLDLALDHNSHTAQKVGKQFAWNVTNSKMKELLYQLFTDSSAMSSWMPHLQALAMTPYCRGRIGVVWIDNHPLDDPYWSAETSMVNQIRLVTQCKWIRQDPWHIMNRLLSKANNRVQRAAYKLLSNDVARAMLDWDPE